MTYSAGSTILAADYNTFAGNTTAGLNRVWSTGAGDAGWGQTDIATVAASGTVTATQWATIVNNLSTSGTQSSTTITSRTAPVTGNLIAILANVQTDITSVTTNRGNAAASGTEYGTFTRYFWNAGGIVRLKYGKSSTGTDNDPEWNQLAGWCGAINLTGRVNGTTQSIAAVSYTGTTRIGGSGGTQTTLATTTGWYNLTASPATIFQLTNSVSPYSGEFIRTTATATSSTVLTLVTTWVSDGSSGAGTTADISGGTATASPSTTITGTAPTTLVTYVPPSSATLSNSWGTPSIAASVA